jgi:hypothetical protein
MCCRTGLLPVHRSIGHLENRHEVSLTPRNFSVNIDDWIEQGVNHGLNRRINLLLFIRRYLVAADQKLAIAMDE